jgi:hypothetical protein
MDAPPEPIPPAPVRTLDDWIELTQEMLERYWKDAEWATIVVGRPGVPNLTFPVTRKSDPGPRPGSHQPSRQAL